MIGYLCKYTPVELFYGFGETPQLIDPQPEAGQEADVHPNLCSFAKSAYSHCAANHINIVATNCCDSVKRIYDALETKVSFRAMLSLPRVKTPESIRLYAAELAGLIQKFEAAEGKKFDKALFKKAASNTFTVKEQGADYIAVLGARMPFWLLQAAQECCILPIQDLTCTGQTRSFGPMPGTEDLDELLEWYAGELLGQTPCMRMQDISQRSEYTSNPHLKGIIYHTIKFCDYYGFEYAGLKKSGSLPILKLETDYTDAGAGQLKTRLEAYFESLGNLADSEAQSSAANQIKLQNEQTKYYVGIDSGSTSTDAVLLDEHRNILGYSIVPTGGRSIDGAQQALADVLAKCGVQKKDVTKTIATGYGRNAVEMGDPVTEITCHAKGAFFLNPQVRTIIDIGGQDSKIIKLDASGSILDFTMNDKCAAGTGRFLEMMANTLALGLEEFAQTGLKWTEDIKISSMCSVFAESEVISLIAQNKAMPDIVHGINQAIVARIYAMIARLNCSGVYMMTGGVAKNRGVVLELSKKLGGEIAIAKEPQICGALGAALIAMER
jgi:predicted CoA-substrate-specific enzyme activase